MAYIVTCNPWTSQYSVGIGTENPSSLLHVVGSNGGNDPYTLIRINSTGTYPCNMAGLAFDNSGVQQHIRFLKNGTEKFQMRYNDGGTETNKFNFYSFITSKDFVTFDANTDKVGIGTTSPSYKLDIGGSGPSFGMSNTSATGYNEMYFSRNTSTVVGYIGVGVNAAVTANGDDFVIQNRLSTGNLVLHTNTTERMRVTCAGNVGIGTASPTTGKLEVAGSILTSGGLVAALANSSALSFESTFSRLIAFGTDASTNGCFRLISSRSDGSNQLTWLAGNASGNVGINCLTPTYKLHVNGTFYAAGSSQDYKQSICNYNTDSCMFMKLKPVTYQYKEEYCHLGKELKSGTQIGLIAEEGA